MVNSERRCVIVSASSVADSEFIRTQICNSDFVICADGGADKLIQTGIIPDLIIGDMDSAKNYTYFKDTNVTVLPVKKDDTDTMYCVKKALEMGFYNFLLLGATGGRIDHTLANLSVLLYLDRHNAVGVISDEFSDISLLKSGRNILTGIRGKTISVMPFASESVTLSYKGMEYPLENGTVTAEYPYSISNVAENDEVEIILHSGKALLVLPRNE